MREVIMGYQGEMSLKGLNRNQFESTMMKILRYRLKTVGKFRVYCTQSTFYMEPEEDDIDMDLAFERVSKVFGLAALSRAVVCEKDFDTICQTAEDYLGDSLHGIKTFKVEARRSDKTFPMTSPELMRELGAYLLGRHNYLRVDVKNPQFKVIVEIRDYGAYIHGPKIQGEGGLPVGTSGRALNMLSGGIDSPVAAYRMAKRGLGLDHIHFASPPYTSERAKLKVKALAQLITPYTGSTNLFVVPYTKPQEYIRDNAPDVLFTVLMRRSMMRIANIIARKQGCEALVTGESLAQVASQTVKALQCTDAAQDLPILRRLAHGQNPMAPDRGHIHHRLIDMGLNQKQAVAALYVISSILGLSAVMLTSSGAIKAMLFLMALAVAAFLASRVIFRRDIDKALQAEKAAAEEKSTETATPAETVPAEPEEESNEKKKEEA